MDIKKPEFSLENYLKAARDSVAVINEAVTKNDKSDESKDMVKRNVDHLKIVVANEEVKKANPDISDINSAITSGDNFLK